MLDSHDRRDLACLGLMVLVYGLALAPVLHATVGHGGGWGGAHGHSHVHAEGHSHAPHAEQDHERGPLLRAHGHQHLAGSVEHLLAVAVAKTHVFAPVTRWVPIRWVVFRGPSRLPGDPPRPTAMPQGP
ncbi:hypothetical protein F0U59_10280 [Archangium gephyra]|nr:hypothetical protein F0U59_10280 [Archangium gephyra]